MRIFTLLVFAVVSLHAQHTSMRLVGNASKPSCTVDARGRFWPTQSSAGIADFIEICDKTAADTYAWRPLISTSTGGSLPTGAIILIVSGSCPSGFTEEASLNGKFVLGTLNGSGDVGGAGGADNVIPSGTNSAPTFTGNALAGHAHTFTGSALAGHAHTFTGSALGTHQHGTGTYATSAHSGTAVDNHASHTHTYTDVPNHVHVQTAHSAATGPNVGYGVDASTNTAVTSGYSTANPTGGVATGTTAGPSATLTHSVTQPSAHTLSGSSEAISGGTPTGSLDSVSAGTPTGTLDSVSGGTPAGSVAAPVFTGNSFDNRPAFVKVIFCRAN